MVAARQSNDRRPGLGSVCFLPRQARFCQFIRLGRGYLCTPLFGALWLSSARKQQSYPLHHFLTYISLVGVASSWSTNDAADGNVLVWAVVGASLAVPRRPLAVLVDPGWNRLSSSFR